MIGQTVECHPSPPVGMTLWLLAALALGALAGYLRHKERAFGPQRVWTYCGRTFRAGGEPPRRLTAIFLALALSGAGWLLWGVLRPSPWAVGGAVLLLVGGFLSLVLWLAG